MAVAMAVAIGLVGALGLSPWRTGAVAQTQETQTQEGQTVEGAGAGQSAPPAKAGDEARPQGDDADTGPVPAIGPAADAGQVLRALGRLPFGETLQYRGRVEKAGIVFEAGRANLRVLLDESGRPNLEARAFGEKFGYILKTRILTVLDPVDFRPIEFGIAPRDLEATDTAQLLGLHAAREALRDAGLLDRDQQAKRRISVLLGVTGALELVIPLGARLGHAKQRSKAHVLRVVEVLAAEQQQRMALE